MKKIVIKLQDDKEIIYKNAIGDPAGSKLSIYEIDSGGTRKRCLAEFDKYDVKTWYEEDDYGNVPKTDQDYLVLAESRGFSWLGPSVLNTESKTNWKCSEGHIWDQNYHNIQQGSGCPNCHFESLAALRRKTPKDYYSLAKERGFKWRGPEVRSNSEKTFWECSLKHRWEAPYSSIQQGIGCPHCYGTFPKSPSDYRILAEERGFQWLGPEVTNTKANTAWVCDAGHRWETPFTTIQSGHGCPVCLDMVHGRLVSKVQRKLCKMLGGELNLPVGKYNVDIALLVNGVQIAVEYDSWFWHAHKINEDDKRDAKLSDAGWRVLRIKTNKKLPNKNQLRTAISQILKGANKTEIILDDWGTGPTRFELE